MQGHKLLHSLISKSSLSIHEKRITALTNAVDALLIGKKLTLTGLARSSQGKAKERHAIRRTDRLLGNEYLHKENEQLYRLLASFVAQENVSILVDWSCVNKKKDWHILRASLVLKGRSQTIYQEVHPKKMINSPAAEKPFLKKLKDILPKNIKVVIITDAGFRATWFKAVRTIGFDWLGRVRNKNYYRTLDNNRWRYTASLYEEATSKVRVIHDATLTKSNSLSCTLLLTKKKMKGRKHKNNDGNYTNNNASNRCAKREREPWLITTSLSINNAADAIKIIALYGKRMQIEEEFRDTKSHKYGFGLRYSLSNKVERISVLLLIATLAMFVCWLIALAAIRKKRQFDYQSNSIKSRTVLSVCYLACQLIRKRERFNKSELLSSLSELKELAITGAFL